MHAAAQLGCEVAAGSSGRFVEREVGGGGEGKDHTTECETAGAVGVQGVAVNRLRVGHGTSLGSALSVDAVEDRFLA
jgi:hypothetical protein